MRASPAANAQTLVVAMGGGGPYPGSLPLPFGVRFKAFPLTLDSSDALRSLCRTGNKCWVPHSSPVLGLSGIRSTSVFGLSLGAQPRDQLQLVSNLHLATADLPRRQFQHAMRSQPDAGHPERSHAMPKLKHL